MNIEMLPPPFAKIGPSRIRAIGVLAPLVQPYWLGVKPVSSLELKTVRHLGPAQSRRVPLCMREPARIRVRRGFVLYRGSWEPDRLTGR